MITYEWRRKRAHCEAGISFGYKNNNRQQKVQLPHLKRLEGRRLRLDEED